MEECLSRADSLCREGHDKDVMEPIIFFLLSTSPENGLQIGLDYIKGRFSTFVQTYGTFKLKII